MCFVETIHSCLLINADSLFNYLFFMGYITLRSLKECLLIKPWLIKQFTAQQKTIKCVCRDIERSDKEVIWLGVRPVMILVFSGSLLRI